MRGHALETAETQRRSGVGGLHARRVDGAVAEGVTAGLVAWTAWWSLGPLITGRDTAGCTAYAPTGAEGG